MRQELRRGEGPRIGGIRLSGGVLCLLELAVP